MSRVAIIDDSDPNIRYNGTWVANTTPRSNNSPEYNGTSHESGDQGGTITYTFTGTKITVWATLYQPASYGIPTSLYTIDSSDPVQFNATGSVPNPHDLNSIISHIPFYVSPDLSDGQHTLTITTDHVSSSSPVFYFDYFTVVMSTGQLVDAPGVIVDDRDTSILYGPGWIVQGSSEEYESTTKQTPGVINGTAIFKFSGLGISAYCTINGDYGTIPVAAFELDDNPVTLWAAPALSGVGYHQQMYHIQGLSADAEHTLKMTAIVMPGVPAWFFDYFVYTPSDASSGGGGSTVGSGVSTGPSTSTLDTSTGPSTSTLNTSTSPKLGAALGGALGGLAFLTLLIVFLYWWRRRGRRRGQYNSATFGLEGEKSLQNTITRFMPPSDSPAHPDPHEMYAGHAGGSEGGSGGGPSGDTSAETSPRMNYRIAPAPYKGQLRRLQEFQQLRENTGTHSDQASSSAVSSLLPTLSRASGTGTTFEVTESTSVYSAGTTQGQPLRVANGDVVGGGGEGRGGRNMENVGGGGGAMGGRALAAHPARRKPAPAPIQEVDAGVRLDPAYFDTELPDTLPPSYAPYQQ